MPKPQQITDVLALKLKAVLGDKIKSIDCYRGDLSIYIDKQDIHNCAKTLRDDPNLDFNQMMDLTAVDYLNYTDRDYRFEVVYHLFSLNNMNRLRIKLKIKEEDLEVPSLHDLWLCVNWYERECYDMYGIIFTGHPKLERILMYKEFEGHPLRKDYPIDREQPLVELKPIAERNNYKNPELPTLDE